MVKVFGSDGQVQLQIHLAEITTLEARQGVTETDRHELQKQKGQTS